MLLKVNSDEEEDVVLQFVLHSKAEFFFIFDIFTFRILLFYSVYVTFAFTMLQALKFLNLLFIPY